MKAIGNAVFSNDGTHRYLLSRLWDERLPVVAFAMLNPSRADAHRLDNTVAACVRMAVSWGYGGLVVVNAYSIVGTDPRCIVESVGDATGGAANLAAFEFALGIVAAMVFAWGNAVDPDYAASLVRKARIAGVETKCLAQTKNGAPHHPRGLPKGLQPLPYDVSDVR